MSLNKNNLFINVAGQGEPLLVLHGWGVDHTIWLTVKHILEKNYTVTWLDLPGYGTNKHYKANHLDEIVTAIQASCTSKTHVMGWSLGGVIAQRLAYLYPTTLKSLILVATNPCFVQKESWSYAMSEQALDAFAVNLVDDRIGTLKRFLSLQFIGVRSVQTKVKQLREAVTTTISPTQHVLTTGLQILKQTDLRQQQSAHKKLWLLGKMDKLVPYQVASDVLALNSTDQLRIVEGAGHAPFVSHPELFSNHVIEFLSHV